MVKDIRSGQAGSFPSGLTDVGGTLYFAARRRHARDELWRSDGTEAGTVMVKDIRPGEFGSGPDDLTDVGGTLYFAADDGTHGCELWRSDGTEAGTVMVKDIRPGGDWLGTPTASPTSGAPCTSGPDDGTHGSELWKIRRDRGRDRDGEGHLVGRFFVNPLGPRAHRRRGHPVLPGRRRHARA